MKTKRSVQRRREAQNVVGKLMETLLDKVIRCVEDKLKEVNKVVEFTLRGGGGKEDCAYAERIMVGVRKTGLPLKLDKITKGDNNCFFNAIFDQIQRYGVAQELAGQEPIRSPHDLRLKVARFAKTSGLPVVDRFKRVYYETYPPEFWDGFWNRMEQDEEWADGIVGQLTA